MAANGNIQQQGDNKKAVALDQPFATANNSIAPQSTASSLHQRDEKPEPPLLGNVLPTPLVVSSSQQHPPQHFVDPRGLVLGNSLVTPESLAYSAVLGGFQQPQPPMLPFLQLATLQPFQTAPVTHNLIPAHLQATALACSLNGTPGHQPALIPPPLPTQPALSPEAVVPPVLTVQDRPMVAPVYNGVNPNYPGVRVLNTSPPIFTVENFLTPYECDFLIHAATDAFGPAPVVGKGSGEISSSRTSSTCYLAREDLPDYLRKVSLLTGKPVQHCELPQVGRYLPSQQYLQHFDAFDLSNEDGRRFAANGGQRTITVLVYLNDVAQGGATAFPALNLEVQPRRGMALVFFPATVDGLLDKMALHAARPAVDTKFVSQVWIRQSDYSGQPSKRLPQTLGVPFGQEHMLDPNMMQSMTT